MVVVLVISGALRARLGYDDTPLAWVTLFGVVLFAVLTGLHLVWNGTVRR
jgi:hypothetical protein